MRLRGRCTRRRDAEIAEEIDSHLRMAIRDRLDRGEAPDEARRHALVEFGSPALAREDARAVWTWTAVEQFLADLRAGAQILWRAPALSATAALLIALVIGGNMTIFSMVHAILAKPAPGIAGDRLVTLGWVTGGEEHPVASYPDYLDVAAASRTVRPMLGIEFGRFVVATADGSYAIQGVTVSTNYFDTLGVRLAQGRPFTERERRLEANGLVAVISDRLWRDRFGASGDIIGRTAVVNGHTVTIIGVGPAGFRGVALGEASDIWMPLVAYAEADGRQAALEDRREAGVVMIGRLAPGVSQAAAQAELSAIAERLPRAAGDAGRRRTVQLFAYSATAAGDSLVAQRGSWFLGMFSIITALTLLVVCANVANLMLARAVVRAREMAVRQSFGASRARIVRIFVAEGLSIAAVAWIAATIFASWTTRALPRLMPPVDGSPARIAFDFSPAWPVLGYAMLLALACTVIVSAAPAVRTCRQDLQPLLKAGEQGVVQGRSTLSSALVVLQLAFCVLLLTTAGLAYRSLSVLNESDLGFDRTNLILVTVNTKTAAATPQENTRLLGTMAERLGALPGVAAVSYARRPVQSFWGRVQALPPGGGVPIAAERNEVGPGYLRAMGLSPRAGRDVDDGDASSTTGRAIVNQHLAAALWPGQPAVGQLLRLATSQAPLVVVGVAPDAFYNGYRRQPDPDFVLVAGTLGPPRRDLAPAPQETTFYVRYKGREDAVLPAIGRALGGVDDRAAIVYTRSMDEQLSSLMWPIHALALLLASFAAVSLLIATMGQYAACAFAVRRRFRDFGVRIALGASRSDIHGAVLFEGLRLTAAGLAGGCALSLAAGLALRSMLYGVTPTDARTYAGVFLLLGAATLAACYLPARRAARIDPMRALREE